MGHMFLFETVRRVDRRQTSSFDKKDNEVVFYSVQHEGLGMLIEKYSKHGFHSLTCISLERIACVYEQWEYQHAW